MTDLKLSPLSRRRFFSNNVKSLLTYGLAQTLWQKRAFADPQTLEFEAWMKSLIEVGERLLVGDSDDLYYQLKMDELYGTADIAELRRHIDFDKVTQNYDFGPRGERFVELDPLTGRIVDRPAPENRRVVTKLAGVCKGAEVPPHGHQNMVSAFLVLHGELEAKIFDKIETRDDSLVFKQSLHQLQTPGMWTALSESRGNIHWFKCNSEDSFFFSMKVNEWQPGERVRGRINLDMARSTELSNGIYQAPIS
jgi:hypothetical protein